MTENFAYLQHLECPGAWHGSQLNRADITAELSDEHIAALDDALRFIKANQLGIDDITRATVPLPALEGLLADVYRELVDGRGVVLLSGFPVERYPLEDVELLYWTLGSHLGIPLSQSVMGDRVGHVTDVSGKDPNERAYRNSLEIPLHTDSADIVGMLSLRAAASGGLSTYASALAVHNAMLATRPDLLEPLYRGYHVHMFGEEAPGESPVSQYRVPVLSERDGQVSACIVPEYIDMAEVALEASLPPIEREAVDTFLATAASDALRFDTMLQPGDISLINNYTVLHSRTSFDDHKAEDQRRYLLRLWLETLDQRPLDPRFNGGAPHGVAPQAHRDATYFAGAEAKVANRGRYGEAQRPRS